MLCFLGGFGTDRRYHRLMHYETVIVQKPSPKLVISWVTAKLTGDEWGFPPDFGQELWITFKV